MLEDHPFPTFPPYSRSNVVSRPLSFVHFSSLRSLPLVLPSSSLGSFPSLFLPSWQRWTLGLGEVRRGGHLLLHLLLLYVS
jgi:hypothetical protein